MSRVVSLVGAVLLSVGIWQGGATYSFVQRAHLAVGRVTSIEELRGPPKPRQRTPINVLYKGRSGQEESAVAHLPLLQNIKEGDEIRILVDPQQPQRARIPLWSELWARPLTYVVGGLLVLIVGRVLRTKALR
jgi:hypothetical protein